MGAVFTIALFFPLMIPMIVLEKIGIDISGMLEQFSASTIAWLEANPETAAKIGEAVRSIFALIAG
ncbi:MAG: hypothetical protein IJO36_06005 [Clostridia bacterium]|nr:hypothetical protein [Clostridia bacterium]